MNMRNALPLLMPLAAAWALVLTISPVRAEMPADSAASVVIVVSADNPLREISRLHLADLYLGRTTRFPDGSAAKPINLKAGSAEREAFLETFLGRSEAQMKSHWSRLIFTGRGRPPAEAATGVALKTLIASDPRAIGYLDSSLVDSSVRTVRVR